MSMIIAHNMSAINTNRQLGVSTRGQASAMEKLSSGYKINTGKDDPSGLVISEKLRAQEVGLQRAVQNTEEAMNVVGIAEGALNEMNNILKKMKTLAVHAASDGVTSPDQVAADQAEIDSAVQTIDRIARTTKFSDQTLLAGGKQISFDTNTLIQGTQNNKLLDANGTNFDQIFRRSDYAVSIGFTGTQSADSVTGIGEVDFAKQAMKAYLEVDTAKGTLSQVDENGKFTQAQSFILTGSKGSRAFNFDKGASVTDLVSQIHSSADTTGVDASLVFSSAQSVSKLNAGNFNGSSITATIDELFDSSGGNIDIELIGTLDQKITATNNDLTVVFKGFNDDNNAMYDVRLNSANGETVLKDWDGTAGRFELSGSLKGLDMQVASAIDRGKTYDSTNVITGFALENATLDSDIYGDGSNVAFSIDDSTMSEGLVAAIGPGGSVEVSVISSDSTSETTNAEVAFQLVAKDKDGNIVAQITTDDITASADKATGGTFTIAAGTPPSATDLNASLLVGIDLEFASTTETGNFGLKTSANPMTVKITSVDVDSTHADATKTSIASLNFNPVNPKGVKEAANYFARNVDTTVTANNIKTLDGKGGLKDLDIKITGSLNDAAAFGGINPSSLNFEIASDTSGGMTLKFAGQELVANWDGKAGSFQGTGALAGLTFSTTEDVSIAGTFGITGVSATAAPAATVSGGSVFNGATGGGVITATLADADMTDELRGYLNNGYELKLSAVGGDDTVDPAGSGAKISFNASLVKGNESIDLGTIMTAPTATGAIAAAPVDVRNAKLLEGLEIGITVGSGGTAPYTINSGATVTIGVAAWTNNAANQSSGVIEQSLLVNGGIKSTIAYQPSVVGGVSHNDDASRAKGTIAVFGNTIAQDGSGAVERGVSNVAFESRTVNGVTTNAASNIKYGMNTDGQGRVYVKFNRDNNSYALYKDASMSAESKVGEGINGQASTEFNNSGLNGLIIDLEAGANDDLFNEKGVYLSFAGIEGNALDAADNNGMTFNGDVIGDGGKTKAGSFDSERTLVTGVELGTNTSEEGQIYMKSVYDHDKGTVQVFAYKDKNLSDENMVAKSEAYNVRDLDGDYKAMSVVLSEIRNDDDTAGTGLGMVLSYEDASFKDMAKSTELFGNITFTNIGARIYSQDYGSNAIVKVNQTQGGIFTYYDTPGDNSSQKLLDAGSAGLTKEFKGQDASLSINGQKVTTDGLNLNVATQDIQARLKFQEGKAGTTTIAQVGYGEGSIFTKIGALNAGGVEADQDGISGLICNAGHVTTEKVENFQNGMQLQLGESSGDQDRTVVSIQSMTMDALGRVVKKGAWEAGSSVVSDKVFTLQDIMGGGQASLASNSLIAMEIIEKSINDVTELRARLGAVQSNLLQTNSNNLAITIENIQKTESGVRDTDMASTMTEFTKQQVLQNAGMTMLSQANSASQNVLQILR